MIQINLEFVGPRAALPSICSRCRDCWDHWWRLANGSSLLQNRTQLNLRERAKFHQIVNPQILLEHSQQTTNKSKHSQK